MPDITSLLAQAVRAGLEARDWKQVELARRAHVSEKHLSRMLSGKVAGSLAMWEHLLKALEMDATLTVSHVAQLDGVQALEEHHEITA